VHIILGRGTGCLTQTVYCTQDEIEVWWWNLQSQLQNPTTKWSLRYLENFQLLTVNREGVPYCISETSYTSLWVERNSTAGGSILFIIGTISSRDVMHGSYCERNEISKIYIFFINLWHRSFTFNSYKSPTWCNNFSVFILTFVYSPTCFGRFPAPRPARPRTITKIRR